MDPDHMGSDSGFTLARIYDSTLPSGVRVLVDRLWPRGISKKEDPGRSDAVDSLVDGWGLDSFPASDPPGCLPPSLTRGDRAEAPNAGASEAESG